MNVSSFVCCNVCVLLCSTNEELQATLQELEDLREQLTECTVEVQQLQEEKQVWWSR